VNYSCVIIVDRSWRRKGQYRRSTTQPRPFAARSVMKTRSRNGVTVDAPWSRHRVTPIYAAVAVLSTGL
jgi:hypothetical protein